MHTLKHTLALYIHIRVCKQMHTHTHTQYIYLYIRHFFLAFKPLNIYLYLVLVAGYLCFRFTFDNQVIY